MSMAKALLDARGSLYDNGQPVVPAALPGLILFGLNETQRDHADAGLALLRREV
jgi:hypothetical protein